MSLGKCHFALILGLVLGCQSVVEAWTAPRMRVPSKVIANQWIGTYTTPSSWRTNGTHFFAGTGAGELYFSRGVAIDTVGDAFYVADSGNHRIQKFVLSTGAAVGWIGKIATTGGTCTAGVGAFTGGWCSGGTSGTGTGNGMFNQPFAVRIDRTNDFMYVSDMQNSRIQKFVLSTGAFVGWIGKIATTGGTCTAGVNQPTSGWCSGGTSGSGTVQGTFGNPYDLAIDSTNNFLYVADTNRQRIQKFVLSTGTFVGWLGKINTTGGTCTAGAGAFTGGWCSGGTYTFGTGDGMFISPQGIEVDPTNNLMFVADTNNNRIQKFVLSTGAFLGWIGKIATTGGTCTAGVGAFTGGWCSGGTSSSGTGDGMFSTPLKMAVDVSNGFLYVADTYNYRIQKFNLSTGAFVGWIGSIGVNGGTCTGPVGSFSGSWCSGGTATDGDANGSMLLPGGLAIDATGNRLYVSDESLGINRYVLSTGAYSATSGALLLSTNSWFNGQTSKQTLNPNFGFDLPAGVALDSNNDQFYVVEETYHYVSKYQLSQGSFLGWLGRIDRIGGTCTAGKSLFTGGWCSGGSATYGIGDGTLNSPLGIAIDPTNDRMYLVDNDNHRIQKYVLSSGSVLGWLGKIGTSGGTCVGAPGTFTGGWCLGGAGGSGTGDGMFMDPAGIAIDVSGDSFYITDGDNARVQKFVLSTGAFVGWIGMIATTGGTCTAGVGAFTGGWCSGGTSGSGLGDGMFAQPYGVAIDAVSNFLYVSDKNNHRVLKFNLSTGAFIGWIGMIATTGGTCTTGVGAFTGGWCAGGTSGAGAGDGMLDGPRGIAIDTVRNALYVADLNNHRIQKFNLSTGAFVGWIGQIGSSGGTCTGSQGEVTRNWCSGGTSEAGTKEGAFTWPKGIAIHSNGQVLIVTDRGRVQRITLPR